MKRLPIHQVEIFRKYLTKNQVSPELLPEILDHLTCEAEEHLWDGKSFEEAFSQIILEADAASLLNLSQETRDFLQQGKSLNDMVFEGRNQQYGAYALRKGYGETMQRSVLMGVTLFLLLVMIPELYARLEPEKTDSDIAFELQMEKVTIRPERSTDLSATASEVDLSNREITQIAAQPVPTQTYLLEMDQVLSPLEGIRIGSPEFFETTRSVSVDDAPVFDVAELDELPEFSTGKSEFAHFLKSHMKYPLEAENACVEGVVELKLIVGRSGNIEEATPISGLGYGFEAEAQRLVQLMPPWKPGKKEGKPVKVCMTLPILFSLANKSL
jgi:protein TonB